MERIVIPYGNLTSTILIGDTKSSVSKLCSEYFNHSKVHIISDDNVAPLYLEEIKSQFDVPVSSSIIKNGESSKSSAVLDKLYLDLSAAGITRTDLVIALGGGVVGDLGAYAAGTYLRGAKFCMIPTTLLSQVDSSVGGKCGINTSFGKNTVGMFNPAGLVLIDPIFLTSLPSRTLSEGMAEVIKYAYISKDLPLDMLLAEGNPDMAKIVSICVKIKADIVTRDLYDTGERMLLNFGHTVGHAVEKLGEYKKFTHGEGVAIGMYFATTMSIIKNSLPKETLQTLKAILEKYSLSYACEYSADELYKYIVGDKKRTANSINFIFLDKNIKAYIEKIPLDELYALLEQAKGGI